MLNPQASSFHPSMIDPIVSSLNDSTEVVPSKNNSSAKSSRKSQKKKNPGTQLKSTAVNESPAESSTPSHIHDSNQLNPTKNYGPKTTSRRREVKGDQKEPNGSNQNVNCDDRKALDLTRVGYQEDNKKNPDHCSNEEIKGDSRGRGSNSKPGKLKNAIANEAQKSDLPSASTFNCDICTSPSEFIAFGSCNHPICTLCSLRMRSKSKDLTCAICKCKLDFVIVCSTSSTSLTKAIDFDSFGIQYFDDQLSYVKRFSTVDLDHRALMLFGDCKKHYSEMQDIRSESVCPIVDCRHRLGSLSGLLRHLKASHNNRMCSLCLDHRHLFLPEHELFQTEQAVAKHIKDQHPRCLFCCINIYDSQFLYQHMRDQHMTCHLCPAIMQQRYYKDATSLTHHIRRDHFLCTYCERLGGNGYLNIAAFNDLAPFVQHLRNAHNVIERDINRLLLSVQVSPSSFNASSSGGDAYYDVNSISGSYGTSTISGEISRQELHASSRAKGNNNRGLSSSAVTTSSGAIHESLRQIPRNMKIAGRVTSSGRFIHDENDESSHALQAIIDANTSGQPLASATASFASHAAGGRNARLHSQNMMVEFPSLSETIPTASDATSSPRGSLSVATSSRNIVTNTVTANRNSFTNPLSLVKEIQKTEAQKRADVEAQQAQESLALQKRIARSLELADAFGVQRYSDVLLSFLASTSSQYNELKSNEVSPISTELLADTNDSHLKSSRSGFYATCDEALAIFKLPTFPISIIQWAKKNTKEVLAMEKKIQDMLVNDDCNSVQFKPMPRDVRELMHVWARFYHLNSYEYQGEPKRYVSMVKRADGSSCLPVKLLSHVARLSSAIIVPPDSLGQPKNIAEEEIYLKKRRPVLFISAANASSYAVGLVSPVGTDNIASTLSGNKRWTSREGCNLNIGEIVNIVFTEVKNAGKDPSQCLILQLKPVGQSAVQLEFSSLSVALDVYSSLFPTVSTSLGISLFAGMFKDIYSVTTLFSPTYELEKDNSSGWQSTQQSYSFTPPDFEPSQSTRLAFKPESESLRSLQNSSTAVSSNIRNNDDDEWERWETSSAPVSEFSVVTSNRSKAKITAATPNASQTPPFIALGQEVRRNKLPQATVQMMKMKSLPSNATVPVVTAFAYPENSYYAYAHAQSTHNTTSGNDDWEEDWQESSAEIDPIPLDALQIAEPEEAVLVAVDLGISRKSSGKNTRGAFHLLSNDDGSDSDNNCLL